MVTEESKIVPEIDKIKDELLSKRWSDDFMLYEYSPISSGLDFLLYLFKNDKNGNLVGNNPDLGPKLLQLNEELLKIIRNEVLEYDELRKNASEATIKNYYMVLEKKHNYQNPIYEQSIGAIYNYPMKSEKERLEPVKIMPAPSKDSDDTIMSFITKTLGIKESATRPNLLKGDFYIYKMFPKSEARIKSISACITFLCEQFIKMLDDKEWSNSVLTPEMRNQYNEQRYIYMILIFRLMQRDEKCLHKKAKQCMTVLHKNRTDQEEVFPDKYAKECLKSTFPTHVTDISEYKRGIRIVKLFPKSFYKGFWGRINDSFKNQLAKLTMESNPKSDKPKLKGNTEFHVLCFLISCYKHKYHTDDDMETFKFVIERVQELQRLIYIFGMQDTILKDPLASLFSRFSFATLQHIKDLHAIEHSIEHAHEKKVGTMLKLVAMTLRSKKAEGFRNYLGENAAPILLEILTDNFRNADKYDVIHEVLAVIHELHKTLPNWLKSQDKLIHSTTKVWQSFIPDVSSVQKRTWHLQEDFVKVAKLLLGYMQAKPSDVEAAYLLLDFIKNPEYVSMSELKNFLCYELCNEKMTAEDYRKYVDRYIQLLESENPDEKLTLNATSYLMIPMLFHIYKNKLDNIVFGRDYEERLLNVLMGTRNWKSIVQRRLIRLAVLILEHIAKDKVEPSKKTVVIDIWKKIKSEDAAMKSWAFLALAKFANKVQMPNERIQEVIFVFFGDSYGDHKDVVYEAIDSFVPIMFKARELPAAQHEQNLFLLERTIRIHAASIVSLTNVFGMVVRNQEIFRNHKSILYPRMIQAFQKIFFYSKQLSAKSLAFDLAKVMLYWSLDRPNENRHDPKIKETEAQIRDIVGTCFFKELYQLHYILDTDESTDEECAELIYKCLVVLRSILKRSPDQNYRFNPSEQHALVNPQKVFLFIKMNIKRNQ